MLTFCDFRDGLGGRICRSKLGVDISKLDTWRAYEDAMIRHHGGSEGLIEKARMANASSNEKAVLLAALMAADFAGLADEMAAGFAYQAVRGLGEEARTAVAAAIARQDGPA